MDRLDRSTRARSWPAPGTAPAAPAARCSRCSAARTAASARRRSTTGCAPAGRAVGLASVYRALDALAQLELVHRIDVDGTACFEPADPSGEHHHHAICDRCGKKDAFDDPELERLIHGVGERLGYDVGAHDVVLHGAALTARPAERAAATGAAGSCRPKRSFARSAVFEIDRAATVVTTRRQALGLGAAALAAASLKPPRRRPRRPPSAVRARPLGARG